MHPVRPQGAPQLAKLIEKHGRKGNLMVWREMLNADCPRQDGVWSRQGSRAAYEVIE